MHFNDSKLGKKRKLLKSGKRQPPALKFMKASLQKGTVLSNPPNSASISSACKMLVHRPFNWRSCRDDNSGSNRPSIAANAGVRLLTHRSIIVAYLSEDQWKEATSKIFMPSSSLARDPDLFNRLHWSCSSIFNFSSHKNLKLGKKRRLFMSGAKQPLTLKPLKESHFNKGSVLLNLPNNASICSACKMLPSTPDNSRFSKDDISGSDWPSSLVAAGVRVISSVSVFWEACMWN